MELRVRPARRLTARLAAAAVITAGLLVVLPAPAGAAPPLKVPASQTKPPRFFHRSARQVMRIADRAGKVRAERRSHDGKLAPTAYTRGFGQWQVSYFGKGGELAQVRVDDRSGRILEQWTGPQVAWTMARGYSGAFGRKVNAPYVWIPLCVLFLLPFVDPRRPFRLLHLDLLVLLSFGVSHVFFNRGEISTSVPLVYPVLLYLLARMLHAGFRGGERRQRLVPLVPTFWLALGLIFLVGFRVGLNVVDSNVIDVGVAGVVGADRIADGKHLYGNKTSKPVEHGDTYGPADYLAYVPFEQAMPWSGSWDDVPAAHGAAIAFDLLTLVGLIALGRRLRAGPEGRRLGLALGYAWVAYPYTLFALESNSNDTLVGLSVVAAMLALTAKPSRRGLSAVGRGLATGLGGAAKFAPLALMPLFALGPAPAAARWRWAFVALAVAALAIVATFAPFAAQSGVKEIYQRTVEYQNGRDSPFSIWGLHDSLAWVQATVNFATALLIAVASVLPRRRDAIQVAALAAAILLALQLGVNHWFYLYVVWFAPLVLVAVMAPLRSPEEEIVDGPSPEVARDPVPA